MIDRPYQIEGKKEIAAHFNAGRKKVLFVLPTGGGKTKVFCDVLKAMNDRGDKAIMVVRGKDLVEQASQRLFRENVEHGVRQANHWNKRYGANIQICSIDTLIARKEYPPARVVVIDECHLFTSAKCVEFLSHYSDSYILAVTATPYTRESLRHLAEVVVKPTSMKSLIEDGHLVPARVYAPSTPDLTGVRSSLGDYVSSELEKRMNTLTGDIVSHWRSLGQNRATINFAVNIHHSKSIVEQFVREGIPAVHIEGDTPAAERKRVLESLERGELKVVSNVGVLCTGVDLPFVSCLIMARPTKSYNLYIQQAGRGTRPAPGKSDFILLDHAGNTLRHRFITEERKITLDGKPKVEMNLGPEPRTCLGCYAIVKIFPCEQCQWSPPEIVRSAEIEVVGGVLEEIKEIPEAFEISQFVVEMKQIARDRGYKRGWVYYQVKDKWGEEIANRLFKRRQVPAWVRRGA